MELAETMAPVAERLAAAPSVRAAAVVGSQASGVAADGSDIDLFIYVDGNENDLREERDDIVADLAAAGSRVLLGVPGHANTDAWVLEGADVWVDAMYWPTTWAEEELDLRIVRHSPKVGYSTAFWRSIKLAVPIFERDGWHADLQRRASAPYPAELGDAIVHLNRSLIGQEDPFSFRHQIAAAAARGDGVAANNATAKWLASYFDVVFAANRVLHPGEKRLIDFGTKECAMLPARLEADVSALLDLGAGMHPSIGPHVDEMVARLDSEVIKRSG